MSPVQPPYLVAPVKVLSTEARQWQHRGDPEGWGESRSCPEVGSTGTCWKTRGGCTLVRHIPQGMLAVRKAKGRPAARQRERWCWAAKSGWGSGRSVRGPWLWPSESRQA